MFRGSSHGTTKGPMVFWVKEWGTINAQGYIQHIVPLIIEYVHYHPHLQLVQDATPGHGAQSTIKELEKAEIYMVRWPPFSPDLNLIEMVWNWMKNYLQDKFPENMTIHLQMAFS